MHQHVYIIHDKTAEENSATKGQHEFHLVTTEEDLHEAAQDQDQKHGVQSAREKCEIGDFFSNAH